MACDFHTHNTRLGFDAPALVSCAPGEVEQHRFASIELHPWRIAGGGGVCADWLAAAERAAAVGEIGLDKLRGAPYPEQLAAFEAALKVADKLAKPVVIHCVRAWSDLLRLAAPYRGMRKMVHGFRGSPELAAELQAHGFWLSLGRPSLLSKGLCQQVYACRGAGIGFETDDSKLNIESVLDLAAEATGLDRAGLEQLTDRNFMEFIHG